MNAQQSKNETYLLSQIEWELSREAIATGGDRAHEKHIINTWRNWNLGAVERTRR